MAATQRGMVFVDSSNLYHGLKRIGFKMYHLDFVKFADQLLLGRDLVSVRYYAAPVDRTAVPDLYRGQQRFWADLKKEGIEMKLGYLQKRFFRCPECRHERQGVKCEQCGKEFALVEEKGVDVHIAADIVYYAAIDEYDWAYLVSSDGDLAGACERARMLGKKVMYVCVPPIESTALKTACNYTVKKKVADFTACHRAGPG